MFFFGISTLSFYKKKRADMGRNKESGKKKKLTARARKRPAPRWTDIKKFGLKRARTRRIRVRVKHWREGRVKI